MVPLGHDARSRTTHGWRIGFLFSHKMEFGWRHFSGFFPFHPRTHGAWLHSPAAKKGMRKIPVACHVLPCRTRYSVETRTQSCFHKVWKVRERNCTITSSTLPWAGVTVKRVEKECGVLLQIDHPPTHPPGHTRFVVTTDLKRRGKCRAIMARRLRVYIYSEEEIK